MDIEIRCIGSGMVIRAADTDQNNGKVYRVAIGGITQAQAETLAVILGYKTTWLGCEINEAAQ